VAARLTHWIAVDVGPGRLMPWLPVAFGFGIAAYFTAEREPVWWMAAVAAAGLPRSRSPCAAGPSPFRSCWPWRRSPAAF